MSRFVIDASVAIKWVVAESGTAEALALLGNELIAPALLQTECANILWKKVKRGELLADEAKIAAKLLTRAGIVPCASEPDLTQAVKLALALDHPAYDCVYLLAARAAGAPLVTADERLLRVVQSAQHSNAALHGITVLPLVSSRAGPAAP